MRAIHEMQIAEHGGAAGIRSADLLDSALARPMQHAAFDAEVHLIALGAMYAVAIARNHPFIDGTNVSRGSPCE